MMLLVLLTIWSVVVFSPPLRPPWCAVRFRRWEPPFLLPELLCERVLPPLAPIMALLTKFRVFIGIASYLFSLTLMNSWCPVAVAAAVDFGERILAVLVTSVKFVCDWESKAAPAARTSRLLVRNLSSDLTKSWKREPAFVD